MRTSLREDYLEAICIHTGQYSRPPSAQDLSSALHIDEGEVRTDRDCTVTQPMNTLIPIPGFGIPFPHHPGIHPIPMSPEFPPEYPAIPC